MFNKERERLKQLIKEKALIIHDKDDIILSSGKKTNFYFNMKNITLDPEGIFLISTIMFNMIKDLEIDAIGGLTLGADPIATGISIISYQNKKPLKAFIVRKEPKKHGTAQWIEGNLKKGDRVVIVEDVITTGKSSLFAIERVLELGIEPISILAVVDREEQKKERLYELDIEINSIFKAKEFF